METPEKKINYGFYSYKQFQQNKIIYYYLDINGKTLELTEISHHKDNHKFDDHIFKGIVTKYIGKVIH